MDTNNLYWRQLGILSPEQMQDIEVTLIGAGGIGSSTALCLAKMGIPRMVVYDHDTIEEHNLPNQMYPENWFDGYSGNDAVGTSKVEVLKSVLDQFVMRDRDGVTGEIKYGIMRQERYERQLLSGIVISGVDSMSVRQNIWRNVQRDANSVDLYIEARMGAEVAVVYTLFPKNREQGEWYKSNFLYDDMDAIEAPCTARAIFYCGFMIASLISSQVKKFLRKEPLYQELIFNIGSEIGFMANGKYQHNGREYEVSND